LHLVGCFFLDQGGRQPLSPGAWLVVAGAFATLSPLLLHWPGTWAGVTLPALVFFVL